MSTSTLTVALSTFSDNDYRAIDVGKNHPEFFHVYYMKEGVKRVMLVPKKCDNFAKLQQEVAILLGRSNADQRTHGSKDL